MKVSKRQLVHALTVTILLGSLALDLQSCKGKGKSAAKGGTSPTSTPTQTASELVFTTEPGNGTGGSALATQPVIELRDSSGTKVTTGVDATATITLTLTTGTGALSGTASVAAVAGVADFSGSGLKVSLSGIKKITATKADLSGSGGAGTLTKESAQFTISVGAATKLGFVQQPSDTSADNTISPSITVAIQDAGGNTVTGATDNVTMAIGTNPGTGTLSGTATNAAIAGVATFSDLNINKIGSGYTLTASSGALTSTTSSGFAITAGAPSATTSGVSVTPTSVRADGTPVTLTITVLDANSNPVSGVTPTIRPASTGGVNQNRQYMTLGGVDCTGVTCQATCASATNASGQCTMTASSTAMYEVYTTGVDTATRFRITSPVVSSIANSPDDVYFTCPADNGAGFAGGSGTALDPYLVCGPYHFVTMRASGANLAAYYKLIGNITVPTGAAMSLTPVGDSTTAFTGGLDGNGYRIYGWNSSSVSAERGLFGVFNGTLTNVVMVKPTITTSSGDSIGPLVGRMAGGTITSAQVISSAAGAGSITGGSTSKYIGGLVGKVEAGTITSSSSNAAVNGYEDVGGLVGNNAGTITSSSATGNVSYVNSTGYKIGGFVGNNTGTISGSYATGSVTGVHWEAGGFVGECGGGSISTSYATGAVSQKIYAGGFAGYNINCTLEKSYATGSVTTTLNTSGGGSMSYAGGFVGYNTTNGIVRNSYATGNVAAEATSTDSYAGGFVGRNGGTTLEKCYSTGTVTAVDNNHLGGFIAMNCGGWTTGSIFWNTTTSGTTVDNGNLNCNPTNTPQATAVTTVQMQAQTTFDPNPDQAWDWDFTNIWRMGASGNMFPELRWQP